MRATFYGIDVAFKGLQAQRQAMDVTGHNIANANTEGYSRQRVSFQTTDPYTVPNMTRPRAAGQMGTGVTVEEVQRLRDAFLDAQVRTESKALGEWETRRDILEEIEVIFNEPSDSGLRTVLDLFWQSLQELSLSPESTAVRATVRQRAQGVVDTIRHTWRQLDDLQKNVDASLRRKIEEANVLANEIADLNDQIIKAQGAGDNPNDLKDRRGLLIDKLARLIDVEVYEEATGAIRVLVNGIPLVEASRPYALEAVNNPANSDYADVYWQGLGVQADIRSGEIRGLLDMRDVTLVDLKAKLSELTTTLIDNFNAVHRSGYGLDGSTGNNLFEPPVGGTAATISVSAVILADLNKIAASATPAGVPGDGSNALALAQLKHQRLMTGGTSTMDDYIRSVIGQLGVESQEAKRMSKNQALLLDQLDLQRQRLSGVSLDEEMTNLIRFQQAYNAAARLVTVQEEMIATIIERMGLTGR